MAAGRAPFYLRRTKDAMRGHGFFDRPDQRLVLFTAFKDTLDYLEAET